MWGTIVSQNCTYINNTAIGASHNTGGAIFTDRGSAVIEDSLFQGNIANASGGAIFGWSAAGSCKNLTNSTKNLRNTNTKVLMGVKLAGPQCIPTIPCECQNVTISRCTFIDNVARKKGQGGTYLGQKGQGVVVV
jgi:hypothetical protein